MKVKRWIGKKEKEKGKTNGGEQQVGRERAKEKKDKVGKRETEERVDGRKEKRKEGGERREERTKCEGKG